MTKMGNELMFNYFVTENFNFNEGFQMGSTPRRSALLLWYCTCEQWHTQVVEVHVPFADA